MKKKKREKKVRKEEGMDEQSPIVRAKVGLFPYLEAVMETEVTAEDENLDDYQVGRHQ